MDKEKTFLPPSSHSSVFYTIISDKSGNFYIEHPDRFGKLLLEGPFTTKLDAQRTANNRNWNYVE